MDMFRNSLSITRGVYSIDDKSTELNIEKA